MPDFERPFLVVDRGDRPPAEVIEFGRGRLWQARALAVGLLTVVLAFGIAGEPQARAPAPTPGSDTAPPLIETRPAPVSIKLPPIALDLPGRVAMFDVGPTGYAALATADCDDGPHCTGGLAVSHDLRHWQRRPLPPGSLKYGVPIPMVLGDGVVLLQSFQHEHRAWYSGDGGRSWRAAPTTTGPVTADASSGRLMVETLDQPGAGLCDATRLVVYQRATGQRAPLRRQPHLRACPGQSLADPAGRIMVAGLEATYDHVAVVAESTDFGAHWRITRLTGTGAAGHVHLTSNGRDPYAVVYGFPESSSASVIAAFLRTGDFWTPVWRAHGSEPAGIDQVIVCPGGLLLATWWLSDVDHGSRLMFTRNHGEDWYLAERLAGIFATALPDGDGWYGWYQNHPVYSRDCQHWYGLPVG